MGKIPDTKVAEIRDRTDIVAIIGEHVQLRRAGTNHLGLCPFHNEKSPSFNVSQQKQFFYCFGCQKSGDVFRFLMELEGRSFSDVIRDLARRAGIDIPETEEETPHRKAQKLQAESDRMRLLKLCELAARFYEAQLTHHPRAQEYIRSRGISAELQQRFRLGYAPDAWDALLKVLAQRGVPHELAELSGMLIRREGVAALAPGAPATPHSHYDRFRERVMFPLLVPVVGAAAKTAASLGDVIAFGGRVLPALAAKDAAGGAGKTEGAKYINSPETPLYKKGDNLFGLHAAREPIRLRRQVVVVEGNFDVISLHQHGFDNTVAPMGTALTETQVQKMSRLLGPDGHVVLMLDGDRAGRSATLKDIALFSQSNLQEVALFSQREVDVRVARLPDGEDPDTFAQRNPEALQRIIRTARPALDYVLDEAIALAEHDNVAGKTRVIEKVMPLLAAVKNQSVRELHVDRLASSLGLAGAQILRQLGRQLGVGAGASSSVVAAAGTYEPVTPPAAPYGPGGRRPFSPGGRSFGGAGQGDGPGRSYEPRPDSARSYQPGPGQGQAGRSYPGQAGRTYQPGPGQGQSPRSYQGQGQSARPYADHGGYDASAGRFEPVSDPGSELPPALDERERVSVPAKKSPLEQAGATTARNLLALCGDHPQLLAQLPEETLGYIDSPILSELLREARDLACSGEVVSTEKLIELAPQEAQRAVATVAMSGKFIGIEQPEAELLRICRDLRVSAIQREVIDLQKALVRMNKAGQESSKLELLGRIQELTLLRADLLSNRHTEKGHREPPGPGAPTAALAVTGDTAR